MRRHIGIALICVATTIGIGVLLYRIYVDDLLRKPIMVLVFGGMISMVLGLALLFRTGTAKRGFDVMVPTKSGEEARHD